VLGGGEVGAGVAILRGVATADVAALKAHAEMDPGVAGLEAIFAAFGRGFDFLDVIFDVTAGCHGWSLREKFAAGLSWAVLNHKGTLAGRGVGRAGDSSAAFTGVSVEEHDNGRGRRRGGVELAERAGSDGLSGRAEIRDDDAAGFGGPAVGDEFSLDGGVVAAGHVEDEAGGGGDAGEAVGLAGGEMASGEEDARARDAAGERKSGEGGGSESGGDSGDDLKGNGGGGEGFNLFGGAAKEERVATLETNDAGAGASVLDHQAVDFFLGNGLAAAALADVLKEGSVGGEGEDFGGDEIVVEQAGGGSDEGVGAQGEQVERAWSGADEIDTAGLGWGAHDFGSVAEMSRRRSRVCWTGQACGSQCWREASMCRACLRRSPGG
jgi:hypothetical protein